MADATLPAIVIRETDKTTKRLVLAGVAVALALSAAALTLTLRQPDPPVFISVSLRSLVEEHMLSTIGPEVTPFEAETRTAEFSRALDAAIGDLAAEEGVIVLASEAVLGAQVPDFTEEVRLRARAHAADLAARRGALPPTYDGAGATGLLQGLERDLDALAVAANLRPPAEDRP
jgi:hypothetical protein